LEFFQRLLGCGLTLNKFDSTMKTLRFGVWAVAVAVTLLGFTRTYGGDAALPEVLDIPFKRYVLKNGLRLIVHEDRKAPIVAVNVWYHVGSKNEKPGRTGFAHLFEHLMFNGSENFNDDYFKALEKVGATDMNGTTNEDRTNYFENAPKDALDIVLWMESDRMGHFAGAISQERLDEQRGVVQNEKRQGENQPYGRAYELITQSTYPSHHPYSWTVIGSMEDLNAASLDDVKEWFKTYYGTANSVLVIAGDVVAEEVKAKVEKYFGDIPSGPPVARHETWIAKRTGSQRQLLQDRVPQARLYKVWNVPPYRSEEADYLELFASLLTSGKNSRLYHRLVYQDQIATAVNARLDSREIGGQFHITVTARPGEDLAKVERVLNEELKRLIEEGPTEAELKRVKIAQLASFLRGAERIGGFGGKSDILAMNEVFAGDPAYYKESVQRVREATPEQVRASAQTWLTDGDFNLEVHPFPDYQTSKEGVDRSKLPELGAVADAEFPKLQRAQLANGLKIVLAERHSVPIVNVSLTLDAGYAADQGGLAGTAKLAMNMLDEGTASRNALEINDELQSLGATLTTSSSLDDSFVALSALKANLDASLAVFGEVILQPSFPEEEFKRLQKLQVDAVKREKVQPMSMALRVFPQLMYGEGHAYANPFTGSGTVPSVSKMTVADTKKFHETWFKPNNATLIVVGDTTMSEIKPKLEALFGEWKAGTVPPKNVARVAPPDASVVYLIDRPGSIQSMIFGGNLTLPRDNPSEIALQTFNDVYGGSFTARLNMNLREDKHWSYGARSLVVGARGQRPFLSYAAVQSDKTSESIAEVAKELRAMLGGNPPSEEEIAKVTKRQVLELSGTWETIDAVGGSIQEIVSFGLPDDYFGTLSTRLRSLELEAVRATGPQLMQPDRMVWVIVGDLAKIRSGVEALNLGPIRLIDADGQPVASASSAGGQ